MKPVMIILMAACCIISFSSFAQDSSRQKPQNKQEYSCPMHPEITSDKPGKCSKCGMDLKLTEKTPLLYSCPMHPEITSDKPGKCSKCGMVLKQKESSAAVFSCPMKCEGDKTYSKAGKCPKCGMALQQKKDKATTPH